jgi:hypothetical protein
MQRKPTAAHSRDIVKLPQMPLANAMSTIVVIAIGLLALRNTSIAGPSRWIAIPISENRLFMRNVWESQVWASATFSLTVGLLCLSVVGVIFRRGRRRAFWIAFSLSGWNSLLLAFSPLVQTAIPHSIVRLLLNPINESDVLLWGVVNKTSIPLDFARVTCSLVSLLSALFGGVIASCVFATYQNVNPRVALRGDAELPAREE